jgi:hemerythrin
MALIQWTEKLSVGVKQFDDEHKKLVGMLNELFDGMMAGKGKDVLGKVLDGLIEYTKSHFANEERLMVTYGYPELATHKFEHDSLAKQVLEVQRKYKEGGSAVLSMDVLNFLKGWLEKHIQGSDKKYAPLFNAKGIK